MKTETEEQRIIRHADIIVINSGYTGELDNDCLDVIGLLTKSELPPPLAVVRDDLRKIQPANVESSGTINLEITKQFIQKNYDDVRNHLLNNGYINEPDHTRKWMLNDEGKLMKKLGGHKNYQSYKKRELDALRSDQNSKIYWWVREIFKWVIAAALGYGLRLLTEPNHTLAKESRPTTQTIGKDTTRTIRHN